MQRLVLRDMEHGIMKTVLLHTLLKPALEGHMNKIHRILARKAATSVAGGIAQKE
jgi:hypothetical protein